MRRPFAVFERVAALFLACVAVCCAATAPTEAVFASVRNSPPELYAFLLRMPKGADLHTHLSGAVYAETYLADAAQRGVCVDLQKMDFVQGEGASCGDGQMPAAKLMLNGALESRLVDSLSMRDFVPGRQSGHDHFFAAFDKFGPLSHEAQGGLLAHVVERAAAQNESYLEIMAVSASGAVHELGKQVGFEADMDATYKKLVSGGLENAAAAIRTHVDDIEKGRIAALGCDSNPSTAACRLKVRYIFQVSRESPAEQVFAQILAGFYLASIDPRVAAVNLVQPEDGALSMRDYSLQMRMLAFARRQFPRVHLTLHAGELWNGLVPPDGLRFHIRKAVEVAHAERIGHGVDIGFEDDAAATLEQMRRDRIDVEINLTSNAQILGVSGKEHPFPLYRKFGVPVTLSTDDEGVERTHLTMEYLRAVQSYDLKYADVKEIARNSLEYSFLPGGSYWANERYERPVAACASGVHSESCKKYLSGSEKAQIQLDLERRFAVFEADPLGTKATIVH